MKGDSNISRRRMLATLGMWPFVALAACDSLDPRKRRPADVRLYGTATLDIGQSWVELERSLGARILFKDNGNDAGPVIAQMLGGSAATDYDLGGLLGGAESVLAQAGRIRPWDLSKLPNWVTAWSWATQIKHSRWNGQQYGLPLVVNADSMIVLPDRIKTVPGYESGSVDSYAAVFDPRLKGRTSMEDAWVNSAVFTAIYLKQNQLLSIADPGNLTETELKGVMEFLIDKKRSGQFRKFWNGWEQGVEVMRSGEVWVMTGWEPIVKALQDQGIRAEYAVPKEGYEGWSIDLLIHAGAETRGLLDLCHAIGNWLHDGYYGATLAELRGYAVPNETSMRYLREHASDKSKVGTEVIERVKRKIENTIFWQNVRPDNYRLYEEWWSRLRAS